MHLAKSAYHFTTSPFFFFKKNQACAIPRVSYCIKKNDGLNNEVQSVFCRRPQFKSLSYMLHVLSKHELVRYFELLFPNIRFSLILFCMGIMNTVFAYLNA